MGSPLPLGLPVGVRRVDAAVQGAPRHLRRQPQHPLSSRAQAHAQLGLLACDERAVEPPDGAQARDAHHGVPAALVDRLQHYFSTYKLLPGSSSAVTVAGVYGRDHAMKVVQASIEDYEEEYGSEPLGPDGS